MAKKKSRANGEGSVFKNTRNGKLIGWRGAITIGRDENGKLKRKEFTGKTQESVIKKMNINLNHLKDTIVFIKII